MGQHYLAMRQFERCRSELAAEFDMAPDPSTVELHEAIRRRQRV